MEGSEPTTPVPASASAVPTPFPSSPSATGATRKPGSRRKSTSDAEAPATLNQVRYPCLMNMDYHGAREAWLDLVHRWLMFAVIVAGASALFDTWHPMRVVGPVIAAICGALDLTFDLSNRARLHAMFRRRYAEILSEANRSPDKLQELRCKLDELSGEEEPPFHAQLALSAMKGQNATYGEVCHPCRPSWFYRRLANVWRFDGHDFNEVSGPKGLLARLFRL